MSMHKEYMKEVDQEFNYSATWVPTMPVAPGDVGKIRDYHYTHYSTLKDLGIKFQVERGNAQADYELRSANSVTITSKSSGKVPPTGVNIAKADAGISIKFSREKAFMLRFSKCSSLRIRDLDSVGNEILARYNSKPRKWDPMNVVVTEAVKSEMATIIISNSSDAQLDLVAKGKIGLSKLTLADIDVNFQVAKESNISIRVIAKGDLTPLFRTTGIRTPFLRRAKWDHIVGDRTEHVKFGIVNYQDFEVRARALRD